MGGECCVGRWGKSLESGGKFGVRRRGRGGVSRRVGVVHDAAPLVMDENFGAHEAREVA
jgi:hypothetical protein